MSNPIGNLSQLILMTTLILLSAGCALVEPIPNTFNIAINAGAKVNPDSEGRTSPVVLRVYELSSNKAFESLDFFDLYDNDKEVLEKAFVKKQEMELNPNESRQINFVLDSETKYIGFLVAFQDIDSAKWREVHSVEKRVPTGIPVYGLQGVTVNLQKNKIIIENKG